MSVRYTAGGVPLDCPLLPELRDHVDGACDHCGNALAGRQQRWCSPKCSTWAYRQFSKQHDWTDARKAALKRDGRRCVRCRTPEFQEKIGKRWRSNLSVNHIVPRNGKGYGRGCHNHLNNLETLCWPCHNVETQRQRRERKRAAA